MRDSLRSKCLAAAAVAAGLAGLAACTSRPAEYEWQQRSDDPDPTVEPGMKDIAHGSAPADPAEQDAHAGTATAHGDRMLGRGLSR